MQSTIYFLVAYFLKQSTFIPLLLSFKGLILSKLVSTCNDSIPIDLVDVHQITLFKLGISQNTTSIMV